MAASVDSPSPPPAHLNNKESTSSLMVSSPLSSPSSDKRFWSALRSRVDALLENRHRPSSPGQERLSLDHDAGVEESDRAKRRKEDSQLLLRGFDSIAHTLSQLSNNLDNALLGAKCLAEPPTLTEIFHAKLKDQDSKQEDSQNQQNSEEEEKKGLKRKFDPSDSSADEGNDSLKENEQTAVDKKLKKAKNVAVSLAKKAASLARELKSIKSDLGFMQERCSLLEEENRRLRDGFSKGIRPEEDDLMRLQMEALLAEKSRLANENANLTRENQCLHQLVEYHQLTSQDLSASYEQVIRGMCLDFSSPTGEVGTPRADLFGFCTSLDESFQREEEH